MLDSMLVKVERETFDDYLDDIVSVPVVRIWDLLWIQADEQADVHRYQDEQVSIQYHDQPGVHSLLGRAWCIRCLIDLAIDFLRHHCYIYGDTRKGYDRPHFGNVGKLEIGEHMD